MDSHNVGQTWEEEDEAWTAHSSYKFEYNIDICDRQGESDADDMQYECGPEKDTIWQLLVA